MGSVGSVDPDDSAGSGNSADSKRIIVYIFSGKVYLERVAL